MNGLGIVLEEAELLPLRTTLGPPLSPHSFGDAEALLPPLPDEDVMSIGLGASYATPLASPDASPTRSTAPSVEENHKVVLSDLFARPLHVLDPLALNIDAIPITFSAHELHANNTMAQAPAPQASTNTLPLKRLQSLKKGIRKLSLSKIGLSSATSTPTSEHPPPLPVLLPLPVDSHHDASLLLSATDSLRSSTFSAQFLPAMGAHGATAVSTPQVPTHAHLSSAGLMPKTRRRTLSNSQSTSTATTPPLPLPIITLSENLTSSRKNMVSIEQNFFESLGSAPMALAQSVQLPPPEASSPLPDGGLSMLNTSDDLIGYSLYLSEHKKSVETAYDVTKERLSSSGWCSSHDLDNLSLQRDSSLRQIDTKLLQIEEKLNLDFHLSVLNNLPHCNRHAPAKDTALGPDLRASLSPSLKVLESRCMTFSADHGNFHE